MHSSAPTDGRACSPITCHRSIFGRKRGDVLRLEEQPVRGSSNIDITTSWVCLPCPRLNPPKQEVRPVTVRIKNDVGPEHGAVTRVSDLPRIIVRY